MRVDVVEPIDNVVVAVDAPDSVINLSEQFDDPFTTGQVAIFELNNPEEFGNNGQIELLLFDQPGEGAPIAVENFASFVNSGAFTNLAINRGDLGTPGDGLGFVIQAGQFTVDPATSEVSLVPIEAPIQGEPSPARSNLPGTIAFALAGGDPNSATSQFFFNLDDNSFLDPMFTVFGEVLAIEDFAVTNEIVNDPVFAPFQANAGFLPVAGDPTAGGATFAVDDPSAVISFSNISIIEQDELTFTATSSDPELVVPSVDSGNLTLDFVDGQTGTATVTVEATNLLGDTASETFSVSVTEDGEPPGPVEIVAPIDDLVVGVDAPASVINLFENFDDPLTTGQVATFALNDPDEFGNDGQLQVLLFDQEGAGAPAAVETFSSFVNSGAFDNLAVIRGDLGPFEDEMGFAVEAGPISIDPETFEISPVLIEDDIEFPGEPNPNLSNLPGTLAFGLPVLPGTTTPNPDADTNLISFNLADNSDLRDSTFTVFGEVLSPEDFGVVNAIANDPVFAPFQGPITGPFQGGGFLPLQVVDPITGEDVPDMFAVDDQSEVIFFPGISIAQQAELTFTATSSNPELVAPSVEGGDLTLDFAAGQTGTAEVTVEATNLLGDTVTDTFAVTVTDGEIVAPPEPPVVAPPTAVDLDLDGDGITPSVDVLNIFRVLAGAPQAVVVPDGVSQQTVVDAVAALPDLGLDVDNSGTVDSSVDVLNIFRVLAGAPQAVAIPAGVDASQQDVVNAVNALTA